MKTKNWIRVSVVAALLAWPGVETYRLFVAKQQATTCLERQKSVEIALARLKSVEMAGKPAPAAKR
jgi:hypothetical protein